MRPCPAGRDLAIRVETLRLDCVGRTWLAREVSLFSLVRLGCEFNEPEFEIENQYRIERPARKKRGPGLPSRATRPRRERHLLRVVSESRRNSAACRGVSRD